jgi:DNA-binding NarL/FixJ family response regulator
MSTYKSDLTQAEPTVLAEAADAILSSIPRDKEAPFYGEKGFKAKMLRDTIRESKMIPDMTQQYRDLIREHEYQEVMINAKLTARQREAVNLKFSGCTFAEIGRQWGRTKQGAQRVFMQGMRKLIRALRVYQYAGLGDVYRREIHRGLAR